MIYLSRLILRNAFRHPLRTVLTAIGIVVAVMAFALLRTVVDAWYAGAEATSASRLITRNAISLVFSLPIHYLQRIRQIEGVETVSNANWFGGVYLSEKNFFAQFAVDARTYLELYPEFHLAPEQRKAFLLDRQGAIAGRKVASLYGWELGDRIPIRGTIFPGDWSFVLRGIYRGADAKVDETQFFFHWDYLNETVRKVLPARADQTGIYVVGLEDAHDAPQVSARIDALFRNSLAETLTETEKAFQLGFVAMTEAILLVIEVVSLLVILIIMAVMANTMAMAARERKSEYATLKALGFPPRFVVALILGESLLIAAIAGAAGIWLSFPAARYFAAKVGTWFPIFNVSAQTLWLAAAAALLVGVIAALIPAWRAATMTVTDGLRAVG